MDDKRILQSYFSEIQPFSYKSSNRYSTCICAIKDSRKVLQRDITTGKFDPNIECGNFENWLGTMGYLTALDQIGKNIKPKHDRTYDRHNSIFQAIKNYSLRRLSDLDIHAIVALRNAFFHRFNLVNIPDKKDDPKEILKKRHKFSVYSDPFDGSTVAIPTNRWDGNLSPKDWNQRTSTRVNLFQLCELAEEILKNIRVLIRTDNIDLRDQEIDVFINKHTFQIFDV